MTTRTGILALVDIIPTTAFTNDVALLEICRRFVLVTGPGALFEAGSIAGAAPIEVIGESRGKGEEDGDEGDGDKYLGQ
ncbi:hypothetical protein HBI70_136970 [Parastagonospora nodorum]|nr:hypothetical protein HBH43_108970 [Parastagonospora nodorum]KAH4189372.1 hypothetical protein HBH42_142890 [Parastagonospora nodorum]KAH4984778.1 hypothetical protein HBI76_135500 [Parastagonospora nodorum]KAH5029936.1 hypothetical protein HBI75_123960 [Parastagonospora nodorum]KAH5266386.1 hypothetical protein HBI70_136970 [Parastagonospora nodorum]